VNILCMGHTNVKMDLGDFWQRLGNIRGHGKSLMRRFA
jgi:hypothetical protein